MRICIMYVTCKNAKIYIKNKTSNISLRSTFYSYFQEFLSYIYIKYNSVCYNVI